MNTLSSERVHAVQFDECADALSTEEIRRYHADGAILLRQMFSPECYQLIRRDLGERLALLESVHGLTVGDVDDDVEGISRRILALEQKSPETQSILYDSMNGSPALHRFASEPRLLRAVRALLSPTVAIHERFIVLMSLPERQWHLATWHQDWFYNEGPFSTITVYAPLQPTDERNGGLQLALGEHHQGVIEHGEHDHGVKSKWHAISPETVERFGRVVSTTLDVGDVLLFGSLIPHAPRINRSADVRLVINLRYRDLGDPAFLQQGWRTGAIQQAREALARKEGRSN